MPDLIPTSLPDQIASVAREIAMRENIYPKWIASGRLKQDKADHEIAAMRAVLDNLKRQQLVAAVAKDVGGEREKAVSVANTILDDTSRDPDSGVSVLARQFLDLLTGATP